MKEEDIYNLVKELVGDITPVGETNEDTKRFKNLEKAISLVDRIVYDIEEVSKYKDRTEYSMKEAGERAYKFRNSLTRWQNY